MPKEKIAVFYDERHVFYIKEWLEEQSFPDEFLSLNGIQRETLRKWRNDDGNFERMTIAANSGNPSAIRALNSLIAEYKQKNPSKGATFVRWYKVENLRPKFIKADGDFEKSLENADYAGVGDLEDILSFIELKQKELFHLDYVVFKCPVCGQKQFGVLTKGRFCKCSNKDCKSETLNVDDIEVEIKDRFLSGTSEQNKANAIACLYAWDEVKEIEEDDEDDIKFDGVCPYNYKGDVYRIYYTDCRLLHENLYSDFAFEEVLTTTEKGVVFTQEYKKYLKSLDKYGISIVDGQSLFSNVKSARKRIKAEEHPLEKAFFWYMMNYCMPNEKRLVWRVDQKSVSFFDKNDFVNAILSGSEGVVRQLVKIYQAVADLSLEYNFFEGYESSLTDLSRLIYETTGNFTYVTDEKFVNFGKNFIENLHILDGKVSDKNEFIESIRQSSYEFWSKIKGSFTDDDAYLGGLDNTYYDRLCYYQYAICGKKELKYKNLVISDSPVGWEYVKSIVKNAYLAKYVYDDGEYVQLLEFLKNEELSAKLSVIKEKPDEGFFDGQSQEFNYERLCALAKNQNAAKPSIELYLNCASLSSRTIKDAKFWYNDSLDTLLGHIKKLFTGFDNQSVHKEIFEFSKNKDVKSIMEHIFAWTKKGGYQEFEAQCLNGFNRLNETLKKSEKELDELRAKIAQEQLKGVGA